MIFLIYFQTFRVRTSSRLAAMRKMPPEKVSTNQPKDNNVQAETKIAGRKSHLVSRIKQLPAVPKIMLNARMHMAEKSSSDEDDSNLDYLDDLELENDKK